jgi:CRISPR-associated protein Cas5t
MTEPISARKRNELAAAGHIGVNLYGESTVTPFTRELLFRPRLILYLNRLDLADAFRSPRYAVVLGRSQDLCTYPPRAVQIVSLEQRDDAYYEHTLLPLVMGTRTRRGVAVMMPRYVDYRRGRQPNFAQYLMLNERVTLAPAFTQAEPTWCDPAAPLYKDLGRAVIWHRFIEAS